jgi:hypothetical protein
VTIETDRSGPSWGRFFFEARHRGGPCTVKARVRPWVSRPCRALLSSQVRVNPSEPHPAYSQPSTGRNRFAAPPARALLTIRIQLCLPHGLTRLAATTASGSPLTCAPGSSPARGRSKSSRNADDPATPDPPQFFPSERPFPAAALRSARSRVGAHSGTRSHARRAENLDMVKRLIRDLWGKRTEKKALTPEMRDMLVGLDRAYDREGSSDAQQTTASEQHVGETPRH